MLTVVELWVAPEVPLTVTVTGPDCGDTAFAVPALPPPQELKRSKAQIKEPSASAFLACFLSIPPVNAIPITAKPNI